MKPALILSLFLTVVLFDNHHGQSQTKETRNPKEVGAEFWKLETEGVRLKPEGWYKLGNSFFVHPASFPQKKTIGIVSSKYKCSVEERAVNGNHAEIVNDCFNLGQIDDEFRYTPSDKHYYKTDVLHRLVLTDKHWEIAPDGITEREINGPPTWRIENSEPLIWLSLDTAIAYLKKVKEETTNPTLKQNADRTLAQLATLH